jgi:signal peptidase I
LFVALLVFAFRSSILDWNIVPTGSMNPTIVEGDYIFVDRLAYDVRVPFFGWCIGSLGGPARGDIVVFDPPGEIDRYVKRIAGLPGDVIALRNNRLFINGVAATYSGGDLSQQSANHWQGDENIAGRSHPVRLGLIRNDLANFGPIRVPEGQYFLLGDNRDDSKDSRWFGCVTRDRILGRVSKVALSINPQTRWARAERFFYALA